MNNIFKFATKELSQDAFLCWLINWINFPASPMYQCAFATLDLFMGDNKPSSYDKVEVKRQYKKIDVLVLINEKFALIIEDKTNTSEHGNQIARYKEQISIDYPSYQVVTSYIKTGIMYDEDMIKEGTVVITLTDILETLKPFRISVQSEILCNYIDYISEINDNRVYIDSKIKCGKYSEALSTEYGQFSFLNQVFNRRTKRTYIGNEFIDDLKVKPVYIDYIYAGTNRGGTPWCQYCFWGQKYPSKLVNDNLNEYHFVFWRIDCNWIKEDAKDINSKYIADYYIALRHYDSNTKMNEGTRERKKDVYAKFRNACFQFEKDHPELFRPVGVRDNYKESDILYIPVKNLSNMSMKKIQETLLKINRAILDCDSESQ